jgi:hypothetical protein
VIGDDFDGFLGTFKPISPVLQWLYYSQCLSVVCIIVPFRWYHGFGHKSYRVVFTILLFLG